MKALLIVHDNYQEDNRFPLGTAYISSILHSLDVEVQVYCMDVFHYTNEDLAKFLSLYSFDIIGLSFMASRFRETILDLCKIIDENKKGAWFIVGGHMPSALPQYTLEKTGADIVVIGEAEETIKDIVTVLQNNRLTHFRPYIKEDLLEVDGICYRYNNQNCITAPKQSRKDLSTIPLPDWELFPIEKYSTCIKFHEHEDTDRYMSIVTSRGCVNSCNFCYRMTNGYRLRPIKDVIEEINILNHSFGINYFEIQDEMFIISKKRLIEFRDGLKKEGLKIKFTCDGRVNFVDEEILDLLKECGCKFLNFGFESMEQKVLDNMNKHTTVEQNIRAAELTKKSGIAMGLNFIWGNIGDDVNSLRKNVDFIKKYNTYFQLRTIKPVTPYPGCELYRIAIKRGLLKDDDDFFNKFRNSDLLTVNFTELSDKNFYVLLYEANSELIEDHYKHTTGDMKEAEHYKKILLDLYSGKGGKFRGFRSYRRDND